MDSNANRTACPYLQRITQDPQRDADHLSSTDLERPWVNNQGSSLYVNFNDIIKADNCCHVYHLSIYIRRKIDLISKLCQKWFFVLSFFHSFLLVSTRAINYGSWYWQAREDKNVKYYYFFPLKKKVNGTYHDWLVIIGSQTRTQSLFMCVCQLRELSGRLRRAGCHRKGRRQNSDRSNRISEMFQFAMIKREFFDNGFRFPRPF